MKGEQRDQTERMVSSWLTFDMKDWVEAEAGKRKWSVSKFIAETLRTIRERGEEIE